MPWIQLTIEAEEQQLSQLEDALLEQGALAVTLQDNADQPLFEPPPGEIPMWQHTRVTGLFEADSNMDQVIKGLCRTLVIDALPAHKVEALEDRDWEREWLENFKPMQFGKRLWVCPSGHDLPDVEGVFLHLDPGLAFGTGTHETTHLCLEWLESMNLEGLKVIDYGCGSGILGIAALLLGAQSVEGIDNDPQALIASRDNATRNGVADKFELFTPETNPKHQADVLVANILAGPLITLNEAIAQQVKPGGYIALSGVLATQAHEVSTHYEQQFELTETVQRGDWVRIQGRKKG